MRNNVKFIELQEELLAAIGNDSSTTFIEMYTKLKEAQMLANAFVVDKNTKKSRFHRVLEARNQTKIAEFVLKNCKECLQTIGTKFQNPVNPAGTCSRSTETEVSPTRS